MTTLTTLRDIERRLSEAKGPDREIDWAIWNAFDPAWPCDEFTASIDAAVALCERVLPGWRIGFEQAGQFDGNDLTEAWGWPFNNGFEPDWMLGHEGYRSCPDGIRAVGHFIASAICAIPIRALISKAEAGE